MSLAQRPVRHRRLERAVAVAAGGEVLRHRGCPDGDDVAVGAGGQLVAGHVDPVDQSHEVHREVGIPPGQRSGRFGRGGVDVDVGSTQLLDRPGDPTADGVAVGGIDGLSDRLAVGRQGRHGRLDLVWGAGADRHGRPFFDQDVGDRPPDAFGRAGDERPPSGQSEVHCCPLQREITAQLVLSGRQAKSNY